MSESTKCRACDARHSNGGYICWTCAVRLRDALVGRDDVPGLEWMITRLEEASYGGSSFGDGCSGERGKNNTYPQTLNQAAADLLHEIDRAVAGWVRDLAPESEPFGKPRSGVLYLSYRLGDLLGLSHVASILKTVERYNAQVLKMVNRPPSVYCGPCESVLESGERCGTELWAEDTDTRWVECRRCGTHADVDEIRAKLLERVQDEVQTLKNWYVVLRWIGRDVQLKSFNAAMVGVQPRVWLQPDGRRNQKSGVGALPLYSYGDVVAALDAAEAAKPRRGRRTAASCATNARELVER